MMQLTSLSEVLSAALRLIQPGSVKPSIDSEPACKKSRRLQPSQKETLRSASIRSMGQSPAEKFQEPNSKNQGPSSKNQEPISFWNLVLGNWFLNLMSGWNIQINSRC